MPSTFSEFLPWLVTGAGMVFWATWLMGFLNKLRVPDYEYRTKYAPYMVRLSDWTQGLNSIQMQNLSVVAYFVPLAVVYVIVHVVPVDILLLLEPHIGALIAAVLIYVAQQRAFMRWYR